MSMADWFWRNMGVDVRSAVPIELQTPPLASDIIGAGRLHPPSGKPQPRLVSVRAAPSREEWAAWRDSQVTQFAMAAIARLAAEHKDRWIAISWENGEADQMQLNALRERADALEGFTADYEAFCETLGLEPEPLDAA